MLQTCYRALFTEAPNRRKFVCNCQLAHENVQEVEPARSPDDFPGVQSKKLPICHPD